MGNGELCLPMPAWTGTAMQVTVPNFLMDAWDASPSFAVAFCDTYEAVTQGYERAAAEGRLPTTHDVVPDEDKPTFELQKALLRGEGSLGGRVLAAKYGVARSTVHRDAAELGITVFTAKGAARQIAEECFRDGETRPRVILAVIAERMPEAALPKRNTITQWRLRMQEQETA